MSLPMRRLERIARDPKRSAFPSEDEGHIRAKREAAPSLPRLRSAIPLDFAWGHGSSLCLGALVLLLLTTTLTPAVQARVPQPEPTTPAAKDKCTDAATLSAQAPRRMPAKH